MRSRSENSSASPFPHRPPSPKYDDPSGFIELLRYDGCEAHPDVLEDHAEKNVQRTSKSKSRSPASITRSARRRSRRRGFSQLTPPDTGAGVDSTPNSDSVEFRSQGGANMTDDGDNGTLNLGVMCVECIGDTRGDLLPNPRHDSVLVIAMRFSDDGGVTTHDVALILREKHRPTPNNDQELRAKRTRMSWIALGVGASRMARRRTSTFTHSMMRPSCSEGLSTRFVPSTPTSSPVSRSRVHRSGISRSERRCSTSGCCGRFPGMNDDRVQRSDRTMNTVAYTRAESTSRVAL